MTTKELTEEQQRVHGYLMSQGEKYSWLELWPKVLSVRLQLIDALEGLSAEQAEARTTADEWTIMEGLRHEIRRHARDTAPRRATRWRRDLGCRARARPGGHVVRGAAPRVDAQRHAVRDPRRRAARGRPAWPDCAARHFRGPAPPRAWYIFQRIHDADHVTQFRSIREAPDFPGRQCRLAGSAAQTRPTRRPLRRCVRAKKGRAVGEECRRCRERSGATSAVQRTPSLTGERRGVGGPDGLLLSGVRVDSRTNDPPSRECSAWT